jgi:mRNA interferase MazF
MLNLKRGDIITLEFPFVDKPEESKLRPALIIQNDVGNRYSENTIVLMITSSLPSSELYPVQVLIPEGPKTGLKKSSIADAGVVFTISKDRIKNRIGECPWKIMQEVNKAIRVSLDV